MLKLALNKSICASDDEQGINKLWSKQKNLKKFIGSNKIEKNKVKKRQIQKLKTRQILSTMPDKFKVTLLQASTKNNYFLKLTNQKNM